MNCLFPMAGFAALIFAVPAMALAQPVENVGLSEAAEAFRSFELAYEADDIVSARIDLRSAINCLAGPGGRGFSAVEGDPCDHEGRGAVRDIGSLSLKQLMTFALGDAASGLKSFNLSGLRMAALSAMDEMRAVREAWLFPTAVMPRHSRNSAIKLSPDEIRLSRLKGAMVRNRAGNDIGKIVDMVLDTEPRVIRLVGLAPDKSDRGVLALRWSELQLSPAIEPASGYVSAVSAVAIAGAPQYLDEARSRSSYIDIERGLLGRPVEAADGKEIGELADLVVESRSGAVDYVLISGNSALGAPNTLLALRWSAIADLKIEHDIVLNLDEEQLITSPVFTPGVAGPITPSAAEDQ